jgi:hypothetical protein
MVSLVGYQIEQIEGVLCIAENNLYLYPSTFMISRTVLEINILIEWMGSVLHLLESIITLGKIKNS